MKKQFLVVAVVVFFCGCKELKTRVESGRFYEQIAPSGIYASMYVEPDDVSRVSVEVSSEAYEADSVTSYFDGSEVERVLIKNNGKTLVVSLEDLDFDSDDFRLIVAVVGESDVSKKKYKLVEVE